MYKRYTFVHRVNNDGVFMFRKTRVTALDCNNDSGRHRFWLLKNNNYFTQDSDFSFTRNSEGLSVLKEV